MIDSDLSTTKHGYLYAVKREILAVQEEEVNDLKEDQQQLQAGINERESQINDMKKRRDESRTGRIQEKLNVVEFLLDLRKDLEDMPATND